MNERLREIAERITALREICDVSVDEAAAACSMSNEEYLEHERGEHDLSFTFLYNISKVLRVDLVELLTGETPKLSTFSIIRSGEGLPIKRRKGFTYQHLAYLIKDKISEPFLVYAPYDKDAEDAPIALSYHEGQEFDYILEGSLKMRVDNHEFILNAGDAVYYDSSHGHGMIAADGKPCKFLAVVMKRVKKED